MVLWTTFVSVSGRSRCKTAFLKPGSCHRIIFYIRKQNNNLNHEPESKRKFGTDAEAFEGYAIWVNLSTEPKHIFVSSSTFLVLVNTKIATSLGLLYQGSFWPGFARAWDSSGIFVIQAIFLQLLPMWCCVCCCYIVFALLISGFYT